MAGPSGTGQDLIKLVLQRAVAGRDDATSPGHGDIGLVMGRRRGVGGDGVEDAGTGGSALRSGVLAGCQRQQPSDNNDGKSVAHHHFMRTLPETRLATSLPRSSAS